LIQGSGLNALEIGSPTGAGFAYIESGNGTLQTVTVGNVGENGSITIIGGSADGAFSGIDIGFASGTGTQTVIARDSITIVGGTAPAGSFASSIETFGGDQTVTAGAGGITLTAGTGSTGNNDAIIAQHAAGFTQSVSSSGTIRLTGGSDFGSAQIRNIAGTSQTITANDLILEMPATGAASNSSAQINGRDQFINVTNGIVLNAANPNQTNTADRTRIFGVGSLQDVTAGYIEIINESVAGASIIQVGAGAQIINTTGMNAAGEGIRLENNGTGGIGITCAGVIGGQCNDQQVTVTNADFVRLLATNPAGIGGAGITAASATGVAGLANQTVRTQGTGLNSLEIGGPGNAFNAGLFGDGPTQTVIVGNPGESGSITINGGQNTGDTRGVVIMAGFNSGNTTQTVTVQDSITILGGSNPNGSRLVGISASGDQTVTAGAGGITLTGGAAGANNAARIEQLGAGFDQTLTLNNGGNLILTGGNGVNSNEAIIENRGGNITIQQGSGAGATDVILTGGGGTNSFDNSAAIEGTDPVGSDVLIDIDGDLILTGGSEATASDTETEIFADNNGNVTLMVGGNVVLTGGAGTDTEASIDAEFTLDLDAGGSLTIVGGSGTEAGASLSAQIVRVDTGGGITITGGSGARSAVGIGGVSEVGGSVMIVLGDTAPIGGDISISGGSGNGFTGLATICEAFPCNADISIKTDGSLSLQNGSGSQAFIGSGTESQEIIDLVTADGDVIVTQDAGVIDITAGSGGAGGIDLNDGQLANANDNVFLTVANTTGGISQSANGVIDIGSSTLFANTGGGDVSLLGVGNIIGTLVTNIGLCGNLAFVNSVATVLGDNSVCGDAIVTSANGIDINGLINAGSTLTLDGGTGAVDISGSLTVAGDVNISGADVLLNSSSTDIAAAGFNVSITTTGATSAGVAGLGIPDISAASLTINSSTGVGLQTDVSTLNINNTSSGAVNVLNLSTGLTADVVNTGRSVSLTSTGGSIALGVVDGSTVDIQSGSTILDTNGAALNITANTFTYTALSGIGSFTDPIETQISNPFTLTTTSGDIGIAQTGTLNLTGNTSTSGSINLSATTGLTINDASLTGNNVQLSGPTVQVAAFSHNAQVNALGDLDIINATNLIVQGSDTNSDGFAKILAGGSINIVAANVDVLAGDADFAFASIDPTSLILNLSGDLNLIGGAGAMSEAVLAAESVSITTSGEVILIGGTGDDAFALINATVSDVNIISSNVILETGTGSNSDAVIIANAGTGTIGIETLACVNCVSFVTDPLLDPQSQNGIFGNLDSTTIPTISADSDVPENQQVIVALEPVQETLIVDEEIIVSEVSELSETESPLPLSEEEEEEEEPILECR